MPKDEGKKPHSLPDPKLPIGGTSEGSDDMSHEEWHDIQQSVGALGPQAKIKAKKKSNKYASVNRHLIKKLRG